jgi:hypothetical protein
MGQYWQVINLDKRQTRGHWGKLGECLLDGSPNTLVPLLKQDATDHSRSSAIPPEKTWAADRIICLGDYHEDLPAGMLTTSEQEELENTGDEEDGMELYSFADDQYQYVDGIDGCNRLEQNGQNLVLRNLSKHEYVREEAIKVNSFDRGGNSYPIGEIGLGQVVLSRICWSTDDSCAMRYEEDIHRGVWAGNRFDITTIDQFKLVDGEQEWKDVSDEVAKEMTEIWVSEYGEKWLEHKVSANTFVVVNRF